MKKLCNILTVIFFLSGFSYASAQDKKNSKNIELKEECFRICSEDDDSQARKAFQRVCESMSPINESYYPSKAVSEALINEPNQKLIELTSIHRPVLKSIPADNLFSVSFISEKEGEINIYGMEARLLKTKNLEPSISEQSYQIEVSDYVSGPYYVEIITENDRKVIQFIKE
ncbi:MAG: hypothetical protein ACJATA_000809 [Sphingobacteriales bacterium]|jgi:hypothetical protein